MFRAKSHEEDIINTSNIKVAWKADDKGEFKILVLYHQDEGKVYLFYGTEEERDKDFERLWKHLSGPL